jgi:Cytochrome C assembly protein
MSEVLKHTHAHFAPKVKLDGAQLLSYLPVLLATGGAALFALVRLRAGGAHFISDGALMMLALAAYLVAAVFHLTNLYAPSNLFQRLGLWGATAGVFCNLASWAVRWVAAYERELAIIVKQGREMPWFFRYIPFANLYDLSLAFACGAGLATLLIAHRQSYRFIGALSLPLASLILILARFIGGEMANLPPVLDSYWRPIHVGTASLSYGVALVCFAVAVIYLLKDGVKTEAMAVWSSLFALAVLFSISRFSLFAPATFGTYTASTFIGTASGHAASLPLRADVPYVGWLLVLCGLLLACVVASFLMYLKRNDERARKIGHRLLKLALGAQIAAVGVLAYQVQTTTNVAAHIDAGQYAKFGEYLAEQTMGRETAMRLSQAQLERMAADFVATRGSALSVSLQSNPVELSALITALAGTLFARKHDIEIGSNTILHQNFILTVSIFSPSAISCFPSLRGLYRCET